jgi:hypothetical protein
MALLAGRSTGEAERCEDASAVFVVLDAEQAERQPRTGRLGCPVSRPAKGTHASPPT